MLRNDSLAAKAIVVLAIIAIAAIAAASALFISVHFSFESGQQGLRQEFYEMKPDGSVAEIGMQLCDGVDPDLRRDILRFKEFHNNTAVRWTGVVRPSVTGRYRFGLETAGGASVRIAGRELASKQEGGSSARVYSDAGIWLIGGMNYDLELEWSRKASSDGVKLLWHRTLSGEKWSEVPGECLFTRENDVSPAIERVDCSNAVLDRASADFGGLVRLVGRNLDGVSRVVLAPIGVESTLPAVQMPVVESGGDSLSFELPEDIAAGAYVLEVMADGLPIATSAELLVEAEPTGAARTEHPRPDWRRTSWKTLNGTWDFAFDPGESGLSEGWWDEVAGEFPLRINVPYSWTSSASGIGDDEYSGQAWYRRIFDVDSSWFGNESRVILHFGAVDANCRVFVNGLEAVSHEGGYTPFEADITELVQPEGNVMAIWVEDEGLYGDDSFPALIGKQGHSAPCGYTKTCGIWQSVWLELRGASSFTSAGFARVGEDVSANVALNVSEPGNYQIGWSFESALFNVESDVDVATGSSWSGSWSGDLPAGQSVVSLIAPTSGGLLEWSADEPNLYYGKLTLSRGSVVVDEVETYFGLRSVGACESDGVPYVSANGDAVYFAGLLDQGFWPAGVYTAPSEEALKRDVVEMKKLGFNMMRKHLKIEDPVQYYWCDKVGVYVWQDMPHATAMNSRSEGGDALGRTLYESCLTEAIERDIRHPSIIAYVLMNETWGVDDPGLRASDGMTTEEWQRSLYHKAKDLRPDVLVEDMSPNKHDHVQPTDLNTFHVYPQTHDAAVEAFSSAAENTFVGSTWNFRDGYIQEDEPLIVSEYGEITAYAGEGDVTDAFSYQTEVIVGIPQISGFVYTEAYDVEYERNGLFKYGRSLKDIDYDSIRALLSNCSAG